MKTLNLKELKKAVADLEPSDVKLSGGRKAGDGMTIKVVRIISKHFEEVDMFDRINLLAQRLSKQFDEIFVIEPFTPEEEKLLKNIKSKRKRKS